MTHRADKKIFLPLRESELIIHRNNYPDWSLKVEKLNILYLSDKTCNTQPIVLTLLLNCQSISNIIVILLARAWLNSISIFN